MTKTIKKAFSILLMISMVLALFSFNVFSAGTVSYNVNLYEGGRVDVTGNVTSGTGVQITLLVAKSGVAVGSSTIIYIDQQPSTTNGTFLFRFTIPSAQRGATLDFSIGGADIVSIPKKTLIIPDFPINIASVENNSVRVGIDVYQMESSYYVINTVMDSLVEGGNTIYYKIGDRWYDLMNVNAISSAWLIPVNAVNPTTVSAWLLDTWYPRGGFGTMKFDPILL